MQEINKTEYASATHCLLKIDATKHYLLIGELPTKKGIPMNAFSHLHLSYIETTQEATIDTYENCFLINQCDGLLAIGNSEIINLSKTLYQQLETPCCLVCIHYEESENQNLVAYYKPGLNTAPYIALQHVDGLAGVDLHLHSSSSDGQYTPSEVMRMVHDKGISVCALSDHDTVEGIKEAKDEAKLLGMRCISGIEISSKEDVELHILGYLIDETNEKLIATCNYFKEERKQRAQRIYTYLAKRGIDLLPGSAETYAGSETIGRPHFAQAMVAQGYVATVREAFDKHLDTPDFLAIQRKKIGYHEAIDLIHQAGGLAVLAHPGEIRHLSDEQIKQRIKELVAMGLDGLECYYSTHSKQQIANYIALAKEYQLLVSAGSDFHGEKVKPAIVIGMTNY